MPVVWWGTSPPPEFFCSEVTRKCQNVKNADFDVFFSRCAFTVRNSQKFQLLLLQSQPRALQRSVSSPRVHGSKTRSTGLCIGLKLHFYRINCAIRFFMTYSRIKYKKLIMRDEIPECDRVHKFGVGHCTP